MKKRIKLQQGEEEQFTLFLPQEMIDEILKRLPVKSLVRFSCVCKKWRCLIFADTKFDRAHIGHAAKRVLLLETPSVEDDDDEVLLRTIRCCSEQQLSSGRYTPNIPGIGKSEILGQCNGLFLVGDSSTRNSYTTAPTISKLFLWNPYINSIKLLNTPPEDIWPMHQLIFGLGYDHTRDDYKAIVFFQFQPSGEPQQLPYMMSLRTNSWTYLNSDDDDELLTHHSHSLELMFQDKIATTISGIPYWAASYRKIWKIICFDPISEKFGEVPLPHNNDTIKSHVELRLGAMQGLLCAVIDRQRAGDQVFEVWTMKEYKISWTKLYTFMHPNNFSRQVVPLGYSSEQGEEGLIFVNYKGYWMFNIRDSTGTGRTITDSDPIIRTSLKGANLLYTQSLFLPWLKEL